MIKSNDSAKSLVNLKDYVDLISREIREDIKDLKFNIKERFDISSKMVDSALASADRAVAKAETASEKRFEGVNEFRATLSDQARSFLTRAEFNAKWESVEKSRKDNTSLVLSVLGIIIAVISLLIKFL